MLYDSKSNAVTEFSEVSGNRVVPVDIVQANDIVTELQVINSLVPSSYDYVSLSYTGSNLTGVVFKTGGSGGTTISTLTLAYDGSDNLTSVTKS